MMDILLARRSGVRAARPLVHCLTNHISINDCANALLSVGARPIMAEHPAEAAAITASAEALLVNLGNITDSRLAAMRLSGQTAADKGLPCVLDAVGVAASELRLKFAAEFIAAYRPTLIKGNASEILALQENAARGRGVDADEREAAAPIAALVTLAAGLAERYQATILISGAVDVVAGPSGRYLVKNGHPWLTLLTGTGCVQGALAAAFAAGGKDLVAAALLSAILLGVAGERAARVATGPGSFKAALLDNLYKLSDTELAAAAMIEEAGG